MITKIEIKNFQSHKHSVIDLSNGVNVIVGTSDSGKSAIIRALRWLIYGRPRGDAFRSHWGGDTSVKITLSNGNTIERIKTNTTNIYIINEEKKLKAVGNDVPEEVLSLLQMEEINLQKQIDQPYLLSNTPGEVAAHFNRMADLSKIDTSLQYVNSELRKNKQEIQRLETNAKEHRTLYQSFDWLEEAEKQVEVLKQYYTFIEEKEAAEKNIYKIITSIEDTDTRINRFSAILDAETILNDISILIEKETGLKTLKIDLEDIIEEEKSLTKKISTDTKYLEALSPIDILIEMKLGLADVISDKLDLEELVDYHAEIVKDMDIQQRVNTIQQKRLEGAMKDGCPVCGNKDFELK